VRIAVIGGGISGLAAALRLRDRAPQAQITVYEQAPVPGGKLRTGHLRGVDGTAVRVEAGADAFLVHGPDGGQSAALALACRVGLGDEIVHPATGSAGVVVDGVLHPMPGGTLMGVPGDLSTLDGVAKPAAGLDHDGDRPLLAPGEDVAVGALARRRLGDEVADRLVDPLLGGVYAGRADRLSLAATVPLLAGACRVEHTLTGAVRAALAASRRPAGPVFATVRGGLSTLVDRVVAELGDGTVRCGLPIRELHRTGHGWQLVRGMAVRPEVHEFDAVVLALPAHRAARLLREALPAAAAGIGTVEYASVGLVTLALPAVDLPELSGFLVPVTEGLAVKAATFFPRKWAHHRRADGTVLVRASVGRHGDERVLQASDDDLVALAHRELARIVGPLPAPVDAAVTRWGGALPQYAPGHLDRVAGAREALRGTALALAGAGYAGVGIAACVTSGWAAADEIALECRL
jgi:oxygen-dependent protoporphyrinogen oxidase